MKQLTAKQQTFARLYVEIGNASEAYRQAYDAKRMQRQTVAKRAMELLAKEAVSLQVAAMFKALQEKTLITKERIIMELARLGFFDPRRMFAPDGTLLELTDLDDDTAAAIAGLEVLEIKPSEDSRGGTLKKVRICDKVRSLAELARLCGFMIERKEVQVKGGQLTIIRRLPDGTDEEITPAELLLDFQRREQPGD